MKQHRGLIITIIALSAFFSADMLAVVFEAGFVTLPSMSLREYRVQLGQGEAGRAFADYSVIPRRNLFGLKTPAAKTPVEKTKAQLSPVKKMTAVYRPVNKNPAVAKPKPSPQLPALKLKLKGTISGSAAWARAIVEDLTRSEEVLLKIGEKIQQAELVEIRENEIILVRRGKRLVLKMGDEEKPQAVAAPKRPAPPRKRGPSPMELGILEEVSETGKTVLEKEGLGNKVDDWNWELDRDALVNRVNNLGDLINQVSVVPYYVDGSIQGFRVSNIAGGSLFEELGAQEGDIVEEVNGIRLSNVNQVMSLYSELQVAPELRVRIKRGQGYQFLVYNLR